MHNAVKNLFKFNDCIKGKTADIRPSKVKQYYCKPLKYYFVLLYQQFCKVMRFL